MTQSNKHAKYSPSSMKRLVECPVSGHLEQILSFTECPPSFSAQEGTTTHTLASLWLEDFAKGVSFRIITDDIYTPEMRRHALGYVKYIKNKVEDLMVYPYFMGVEQKVVLDEEKDIWGTCDFIFIYQQKYIWKAIIVDFKYGMGVVVDTKENMQLITYALAALSQYKKEQLIEIEEVEICIYQPRVDFKAESVHYSKEILLGKYLPKIMEAVNKIEEYKNIEMPKSEVQKYQKAGDWCQFCPIKQNGLCKKQMEHSISEFMPKINEILDKMPKDEKELKDAEKTTGLLSKEDIAYLVLNKGKIEKMLDSVYSGAKELLLKGVEIPSLKLIEGTVARSFIDNEEYVSQELMKLGILEPFKITKKLLGITEIEKLVGKGKIDHLLMTDESKKIFKIADETSKKPSAVLRNKDSEALENKLKSLGL